MQSSFESGPVTRHDDSPEWAFLPRDVDTVVLGAGPAGLTAAWELLEAGQSVLVLEKSDAPGGLCRSYEHEGFHFDLGGHRFITRNRDLFDRVSDLLGDALRVQERESVIRLGGKDYRYPLDLAEIVKNERPREIARILGSYIASRLRRGASAAGSETTLEAWLKGRFGNALYKRFFQGYTQKLWGMGADEISSNWAAKRISEIDLKDAIRNAAGLERRTPRTFAMKYCYPRHGIGQIFRVLAHRVEELGGRIQYRSEAVAVRSQDSRVELEVVTPAASRSVTCRHLVSTIPLPDFAKLCDAPVDVHDAASHLKFRSLRFLNLLLDGPHLSTKTWMYVPEARFLATRVQFPANRSPENCPPGKTSIQLEVPCDHGDAICNVPSHELLGRCLEDLDALGLRVDSRRLLGSFTTYARHAYPIYGKDYRNARDVVRKWLHEKPRVETCGRQGEFSYIFFDRAMEHGLEAAGKILGRPVPAKIRDTEPLLPEEARTILG